MWKKQVSMSFPLPLPSTPTAFPPVPFPCSIQAVLGNFLKEKKKFKENGDI